MTRQLGCSSISSALHPGHSRVIVALHSMAKMLLCEVIPDQ